MNYRANKFTITLEEYEEFCSFLEKEIGIVLGSDKIYLVKSRLNDLMENNNINTMNELIERLKMPMEIKLRELVIEQMVTNETNWFRDLHPYFVFVDEVLPKNKNAMRIWSTACSSGQEPYTISICVTEFCEKNNNYKFGGNVKILGTDISSKVLRKAVLGEYTGIELERGIAQDRKKRFFEQLRNGNFKINDIERSRVEFLKFNLLSNFSGFGKFDIIFCRNVLIYFSLDNKIDVINRLANVLNNGGYLFLGSAESVPQQCGQFRTIACDAGIVYQKM